jgi:hypothetical protein
MESMDVAGGTVEGVNRPFDDEGTGGRDEAGFGRTVEHGVKGEESEVGLVVEEVGREGGLFGTVAEERTGEVGGKRTKHGDGMEKGSRSREVPEDCHVASEGGRRA